MKISIITITYNSEKTLEDTIKSVAAQEYPELEYLIIDGGSKDHTLDIVKKYPNVVTKWISEPDKGISDAFNKGISMATGDIIGLINSDDILFKDALKKIGENYNENVDIIYGDKIVVDPNIVSRSYQKALPLNTIQYCLPFCHQSCFIRKSCYERFGLYSLNYKCCMDLDLILKMYKGGAKFQYLEYPLAEFTFGGASDSYASLKEVYDISVKYGLSKSEAKKHYLKCWIRSTTKHVLVKLHLLKFARKVRRNGNIDYYTKY